MRHSDQEHRPGATLASDIVYPSAGILLKQVVNVLDHGGITLANRSDRFAEPADGRAESDAVSVHLPLVVKVFKCPPKIVLVDLLQPNVM